MKHVFIIHGHTLFLTALGVIDYLSLDMRDVVFLYGRNYKNSVCQPLCKIFDVSELYRSLQTGREIITNRKYRRSKIKEVDELVNHAIDDEFTLYVPHFAFAFFQMLYTNNLCREACYIQEGGIPFKKAYSTSFPLYMKIGYYIVNHLIFSDGRLKVPRRWYIEGFLSKQKKIKAFSISDSFFRYLPAERHHVVWPSFKLDLEISPEYPIFVFDGFVSNHHIEQDFYYKKCKELIDIESRSCNYIKFHPMQSKEERVYILSCFQENVEVNELDDGVPFEIVLSSFKGLTVVGFDSSLLYFAEDMGHKVHAYRKWLDESPVFSKFKKQTY